MESLVRHPGTAQVLPPADVGEGGGIFPGLLPFIARRGAAQGARTLHRDIRAAAQGGFRRGRIRM